MKLKALTIPAMLLMLGSCSAETLNSKIHSSSSDVFIATLTKQNIGEYLTYSYSYEESKLTDGRIQFNVTAKFANIDEDYYFVSLKIKFRGVNNIYTIPKSGNTTLTYSTTTLENPSDAVLMIARSGLGIYDIKSGDVYLKA